MHAFDRFLDDPEWRVKWREAEASGMHFRDFLLERFTAAMATIHFSAGTPLRVNVQGMGVRLYKLAFFSKSELAIGFWEDSQRLAPPQPGLGF